MVGAFLAGIATELVSDWKQSRQAKREIKQAVSEYRQERAKSDDQYRHEWELRTLEGADIWPRRIVLAIFTWPLIWAYFDPSGVQVYFAETLAVLPEWYKQAYLGMLAVVWGLSELRSSRAGSRKHE